MDILIFPYAVFNASSYPMSILLDVPETKADTSKTLPLGFL